MAGVAYCDEDDMQMGNIPLPGYISASERLVAAAEEIDARLGAIFKTPFDVTENGPLSRPSRLLLKRANSHLASGRIIMSMDAGGQNNSLHRYGMYLIRTAEEIVSGIVADPESLEGAEFTEGYKKNERGPIISNVDASSKVEDFYDRFKPRYGRIL